MNKRLIYYAIVVAMAGFLFGFDTVVISGANLPIKELWQTSEWFHGTFIMSMALWGTVIGALFAGFPTDKYGRKNTLIGIGVLYFVSAIGSALAQDPYLFSFFRFVGGLGVGVSSIAAPTYISEIASANNRGKLGALYQFNIVFGILIAFISNYLLEGVGGANDWRWMLGVEGIPALIYMLLVFGIPKSPRWLVLHQNNKEAAMEVLQKTSSLEEAQNILEDIVADQQPVGSKREQVFSKKYRVPLLLAFLIAFFNQLSGINFILYYAPEILEKAGFATSDSLFSSIAIGLVNLVFTIAGMYLIDRAGRKQLMYIGSIGYIISLFMVAFGFYTDASAGFKLAFILMFISSHAIGQGAVIWVFISEIFPNNVRAFGQSWGCGVHWVFAALITLFGAVLINVFEPFVVFAFFGGLMVLQLFFVHLMMPETKGKSLEELEKELIK
ncbi:MFS transporter [Reichenbachiella sp. 5M10]|uniref:MFS transporter, sugar porter (SP) family n=1 Tax=Reichenbachiella agariperforans TaxID=156994 RepID=A0A1M6LWU3_REIAG|nr:MULTISPECIES: sugar porter family MFS transporter [Reichenbachiella]PIB34922.1 MFS transporter [Reichenbachiella sp. 5M10]RJE74014.1 MFS transporter [Reichenbachiella sp. MSK19-1]SHJ75744.1 MFS transporter, sugar porter (SP) family [Reichenbachiella agariperforans]